MSIPHILRRVMVLEDLAPFARSFLPRALWEFGSKGTEANLSREGNRQAFDEIWLRPRILNDVTGRSMEKALFGKSYDTPFGISPMGASAMFGFESDEFRACGPGNEHSVCNECQRPDPDGTDCRS